MFKSYVMLARFPKGHVMERMPGPLMTIPVENWDNFLEMMRPSLSEIGIVQNMDGFMAELERHHPEVAEKLNDWGRGVLVQIWREEVPEYTPIARSETIEAAHRQEEAAHRDQQRKNRGVGH